MNNVQRCPPEGVGARLEQLRELQEQGILTDEEYNAGREREARTWREDP
jgi:hypothetical protein